MYLKIKIEYFKCASLKLIMLQYNQTSVFYRKLLWDHICTTCFCIMLSTYVWVRIHTHIYIYVCLLYESTSFHILNGETLRVPFIPFWHFICENREC